MFTPIEKLKYIVLHSFNQCSVFSFVGEAPTHIKKKEGGGCRGATRRTVGRARRRSGARQVVNQHAQA